MYHSSLRRYYLVLVCYGVVVLNCSFISPSLGYVDMIYPYGRSLGVMYS